MNIKTTKNLQNQTGSFNSLEENKLKYQNVLIILFCSVMAIISPFLYIIDFLCIEGFISASIFYALMLGLLLLLLIKKPNSKSCDLYKSLLFGASLLYCSLLPIMMLIRSEDLGGLEFFINERIYQYIFLEVVVLIFLAFISIKFSLSKYGDQLVDPTRDQSSFIYFKKIIKSPLYLSLIVRIFWLIFFETRHISNFATNNSFLKVEYVVLASIPIFIAVFILDLNKYRLGLIIGIIMGLIHIILVIFLIIMNFNPGFGPIIVITSSIVMIFFSIKEIMENVQQKGKIPKIAFIIMRIVLKLRRNPKKIQKLLKNLDLEKNMKVLDYGCGIGSYSIEAAKIIGQSGYVHAVDINKKMIDEVKKMAKKNDCSNIITHIIGNVEELKEENFDLIILRDVLHLFDDKPKIINSLLNILSENGKLLVNFDHIDRSLIEPILDKCKYSNKKEIYEKNWCLML